MPTALHVGCGRDPLPTWLEGHEEVRLDLDKSVEPDIVAPMHQLGDIGPYDVVVCQHALEHLPAHLVAVALQEFKRVLKPGGKCVVAVPDLEDVKPTFDVLYVSGAGPITGFDLFYGKASLVAENFFMAHRSGFVRDTLKEVFEQVGFSEVMVTRAAAYNLLAIGYA